MAVIIESTRVLVCTSSTADDRKTLAAVRSLGRAGAHVTVGGDCLSRPPFRSRFCRRSVCYPNPAVYSDDFVDSLLRFVRVQKYDVLLPLCDYTTSLVSKNKSTFESHVRLAVPDHESWMHAHDKWSAKELAEAAGVECPRTFCPLNEQELNDIAKQIDYPAVLKLRRGAGSERLTFVRSPDHLIQTYRSLPAHSDPVMDYVRPIVQELVPGEVHDVCLLFREGEPRAALTQKRIRMYPNEAGFGIYNVTTDEPELKQRAIELMRSLHWNGPVQVEFKIDSRCGRPKLIDINARFWGTLDLAIQAGVDFPLLTCRLAMTGDVDPKFDYAVGMRYRWTFPYGLLYAWGSNRRWHSLWEFVRPQPGTRSDVTFSDLRPHVGIALSPWWRNNRES